MTDEEYIRYELFKAAPPNLDTPVLMKLRSEGGESRWVTLPRHVQDLVTAVAALTHDQAQALENVIHDVTLGRGDFSPKTQQHIEAVHRLVIGLDQGPQP